MRAGEDSPKPGVATLDRDSPPWKVAGRRGLWWALGTLAFFVLLGFGGPELAPYDPHEQPDITAARLRPPLTRLYAIELRSGVWQLADRVERTPVGLRWERLGKDHQTPAEEVLNLSAEGVKDRRFYLLGSDAFGRDVFSRWLYGARVSLMIGILSVALAMGLGILVGSLAALGGRWLDGILMRLVDGLLSFPWTFLVITLGALYSGGPMMLVLLLGLTSWMSVARLARGELSSLVERDFVLALRGLGAHPWWIFVRHLLPNALPPLLVAATLRIGGLILFETSLSFLGLGVQPPYASWGNMIADGRDHLLSAWWVATFPAIGLVATVVALNLVGDGLRDVFDPRSTTER